MGKLNLDTSGLDKDLAAQVTTDLEQQQARLATNAALREKQTANTNAQLEKIWASAGRDLIDATDAHGLSADTISQDVAEFAQAKTPDDRHARIDAAAAERRPALEQALAEVVVDPGHVEMLRDPVVAAAATAHQDNQDSGTPPLPPAVPILATAPPRTATPTDGQPADRPLPVSLGPTFPYALDPADRYLWADRVTGGMRVSALSAIVTWTDNEAALGGYLQIDEPGFGLVLAEVEVEVLSQGASFVGIGWMRSWVEAEMLWQVRGEVHWRTWTLVDITAAVGYTSAPALPGQVHRLSIGFDYEIGRPTVFPITFALTANATAVGLAAADSSAEVKVRSMTAVVMAGTP